MKRECPELRLVLVTGPRLDAARFAPRDGLEVRPYVHNLFEHLACCDLALVQGGLSTTMELVATRRPFLSFPLQRHFEQCIHVRQRLANPGTATFSTVRWDRGATVWLVSGDLSAEAADGSLVEGRFDCEAIETSGEVVTLVLPSGL